MTLKYRHISYEPDCPNVDCVQGELGGRYRGQEWQIHYPRHLHVPQPHSTLKYRGVAYNMNQPSDRSNLAMGISAAKTPSQTPAVIPRSQTPTTEWQQVHKANVCRLLERRRQRAAARGDQKLLDLLNSEAQQWVC